MASKTQVSNIADSDVQEEYDIPPLYKVVFFNDDYTTMEFVVDLLITDFNKTLEEASAIMLEVHKNGKGIAGIYPYDIAVTKVQKALQKARQEGFPLQIVVEKE